MKMRTLKMAIIATMIAAFFQSCDVPVKTTPAKEVVTETVLNDVVHYYTRAIEEYILWMNSQNPVNEDTLFIGKHPDFPDIALPQVIGNKAIRMIPFEESTSFLHAKDHCIYLNIVATITEPETEFLFVTFREGGKPQHNCKVKLKSQPGSSDIILESFSVDSIYSRPRSK